MKKTKILIALALFTCSTGTLYAQQQEEKVVKPMPAALVKSPGADKQAETGVKPPTPAPVLTDNMEEMKGIEIKPGDKKGQEVKNNDRPKPSTIDQEKKAEPPAKPKAPVVVIPEG